MKDNMPPNPRYIGYVLKRYPRFSETFVVNEILAHERAGMKIDIFALGPVEETHFQDALSRVRAPVSRLIDKQRNTETFWRLLLEARRKLPGFTAKFSVIQHDNVHEVAQAILLALAVCERGIQCLHAHFGTRATTVARLAAWFSDISYTFTAHAKDIYYQYEETTDLAQKLRDAAQTVTVSDYNRAYLQRQYGTAAEKTVRVYNGIELAHFPYTAPVERPRHILAVGRLVEKKGFEVLIDALRLLRSRTGSFHCTLIGDGPLRAALQARIQAAELGNVIVLSGQQPQPDIIKAMQTAYLVVAPCVVSKDGDRDGLPTVLLEAMALGTPVISTQVAGIPELIRDDETGLCIAPNNPAELTAALLRLFNEPATCLRLSLKARERIERDFDIDRNAARLRAIFAASLVQPALCPGENKGKPR
ncbi:glycosyltransferase family 4 protein [Serratia ureilytica]|uniref:glycosyltransferase family 4 protein n=1 Tax=Serratia ureilytica TaxID=300181 RepID=UPI001D19011B|nr:glycosyltransferase family 4 protein [Serratia ureilytica]MCC4106959.1 glycosyltransferase family 4 protein [Serratia ureilytica]